MAAGTTTHSKAKRSLMVDSDIGVPREMVFADRSGPPLRLVRRANPRCSPEEPVVGGDTAAAQDCALFDTTVTAGVVGLTEPEERLTCGPIYEADH